MIRKPCTFPYIIGLDIYKDKIREEINYVINNMKYSKNDLKEKLSLSTRRWTKEGQ